jgi:hypothetical protein
VTDHVFEEIGRYVIAVPPASAGAREAARLAWEPPAAASDVTASEVAVSADVLPAGPGARLNGGRGSGRPRRLYGARQRPLRLTTIAVAACLCRRHAGGWHRCRTPSRQSVSSPERHSRRACQLFKGSISVDSRRPELARPRSIGGPV